MTATKEQRKKISHTWYENNKAFEIARSAAYHKKHPEMQKNYYLRSTYGITLDEYNKMFAEQEGCCAICGRHQTELKTTLCVDHDHKTGVIRELLCNDCNAILGYAKDSIKTLSSAVEYLNKWR